MKKDRDDSGLFSRGFSGGDGGDGGDLKCEPPSTYTLFWTVSKREK